MTFNCRGNPLWLPFYFRFDHIQIDICSNSDQLQTEFDQHLANVKVI